MIAVVRSGQKKTLASAEFMRATPAHTGWSVMRSDASVCVMVAGSVSMAVPIVVCRGLTGSAG